MKNLKTLSRLLFIILACALALPTYSQGVAIYKKDGTIVKYSYEEIDSIVTYNYGETPETPIIPDTPVTPPAETQYEAVDLGLPSGIKWATFNVGATKPEEYGGYYAWGETEEKGNYDWSTYKWGNGSFDTMTKYCTDSYYGTVDNKTTLDLEDDVANVKWGGSWRMPTDAELYELRKNCTWTWTTLNGVRGYTVTGPNGNSIFLPSAGYRGGTNLIESGELGNYWSSSLHAVSSSAGGLSFNGSGYGWDYDGRRIGLSVRPVSE